jgi:signal transduction histidine kinase
VTPIKEAQIQIEKSVSRLSAVFNASQSGMFIFAPVLNSSGEVVDFRFVITNPSFAGYVGQTPEVLNGALGSTWFPGYLTNGVFDMYKHTYLTGETQQVDIHYNVDQHDLYLDLRSTKVGDEVLVTFNDYTPLKRAQLQLEKYIEDLKRTNANLEEFAYAASHDLKEPIRKIMFFSDRIKGSLMEKLTQEETRYFERMETAAKRMSSLIDDLLYYSQVSLRPGMLDKVDLNYLISLVLNDLDLEIEEKNAKVHVDKLFTITGHHRQLQQAFQNLISNALKYSRPGVEPQITISCHKALGKDTGLHLSSEELQKEYYIVSISDNGIGFEQEDAERIFNVFTRLHGTSEYTGTGIGLSIVRKVIENHSGYITAESRKGEGSTFKVFLPQM